MLHNSETLLPKTPHTCCGTWDYHAGTGLRAPYRKFSQQCWKVLWETVGEKSHQHTSSTLSSWSYYTSYFLVEFQVSFTGRNSCLELCKLSQTVMTVEVIGPHGQPNHCCFSKWACCQMAEIFMFVSTDFCCFQSWSEKLHFAMGSGQCRDS